MKRREALPDFKALVMTLLEDHFEARRRLKGEDSPFARRTHVRTAFAMVDGVTFQMKYYSLAIHADEGPVFDEQEVALLKEAAHDLDDAGNITTRPKFLPTKRNVRFACAAFAKANQSQHQLNVGGSGWQAFRRAVDIRNGVVHPKVPADLELGDEQMASVEEGIAWFHEETKRILETSRASRAAEAKDRATNGGDKRAG